MPSTKAKTRTPASIQASLRWRAGQFTHDVRNFVWQFAREITEGPDAFGKPFTGRRMKEDAPAACRKWLCAARRQSGDDSRQNVARAGRRQPDVPGATSGRIAARGR